MRALTTVFLGFFLVSGTLASKPANPVGRPAKKPPVYKKFDNRKKKSTLKLGVPPRSK